MHHHVSKLLVLSLLALVGCVYRPLPYAVEPTYAYAPDMVSYERPPSTTYWRGDRHQHGRRYSRFYDDRNYEPRLQVEPDRRVPREDEFIEQRSRAIEPEEREMRREEPEVPSSRSAPPARSREVCDPIPPAPAPAPAPPRSSSSKEVQTATPTGKPGRVKMPFAPYTELDITGLPSGSLAKDPATGKVFRVP
ncbi:MAG: hypothetical protein ACOYMN_16925 [Roseimicrobium sp.]